MDGERQAQGRCNRLWNFHCTNPGCTKFLCAGKNSLLFYNWQDPSRLPLPYQTSRTISQNLLGPFQFHCPVDWDTPCTTPGCTDLFCDVKRNRERNQAPAAMDPIFFEPYTSRGVSPIGPSSATGSAHVVAAPPIFPPSAATYSTPSAATDSTPSAATDSTVVTAYSHQQTGPDKA